MIRILLSLFTTLMVGSSYAAGSACGSCLTNATNLQKQMSKKGSRYQKCKKKSKSCSSTCSKQDELAGLSSGTKGQGRANYMAASSNYSLVKTKADKVHKKCSNDNKQVKKTCGKITSKITAHIKECEGMAKSNPECAASIGTAVTKLKQLLADPKSRSEGCGALAGTMLPQAKSVSGNMMKMIAALAPMIAAMANSKGGETKKPKEKTCEQRLQSIGKADLRCTDANGSCCKQFPCAKGCEAAGIAKVEGEPTDGGADIVVRKPTSSNSKFGISSTQAESTERAEIEVLTPEAPVITCNPEIETCEEGDIIETSSNSGFSTSTQTSKLGKGNSESDSLTDDPETSGSKSKKVSVPPPTFDSVSGGAWQSSSMDDDDSTSYSDESPIVGANELTHSSKQIAPKAGKSPFELINGAYKRVQRKGLLLSR